jgi:hypothetical protein
MNKFDITTIHPDIRAHTWFVTLSATGIDLVPVFTYRDERITDLVEAKKNNTKPHTDAVWDVLKYLTSYGQLEDAERCLHCKFPKTSDYLIWLLKIGEYQMIKAEIQRGVPFSDDILQWAFAHGASFDIIKWFVENHIGIDNDILSWAITSGATLEMIRWLVEHGAYIVTTDKEYQVFDFGMHSATLKASADIINYFCSLNCKPYHSFYTNIRSRTDLSFDQQKKLCNEFLSLNVKPYRLFDMINPLNTDEQNQYFLDWALSLGIKSHDSDIIKFCSKSMFKFADQLITLSPKAQVTSGHVTPKTWLNRDPAWFIHYHPADIIFVAPESANEKIQSVDDIIISVNKLLPLGLDKSDQTFMCRAVARKSLRLCKFLYKLGFSIENDNEYSSIPNLLILTHLNPVKRNIFEPSFVDEDYEIYHWLCGDLEIDLPHHSYILAYNLLDENERHFYNQEMKNELIKYYGTKKNMSD